ncbi:hypothetical protein [Streptomyces candidus]|uniref:Uncharacterized protein n=1 Tax=Streptomyces candidus TaxID=67283 RepID=A0A7X0HLK1_9ACTN|nr:hypothetical protein [Streptomyces candidus]MBB6439896.1 hypothetical protein [Streptomyces candidus]GHH58099.1 hypothetical protein GCM10018773_66130 [Streptomyces candidus]
MSARDDLLEYADRYGYTEHVNALLDAYRVEVLAAEAPARLKAEQQAQERAATPALPWAHRLNDADLHAFLDGLAHAASNRWRIKHKIPDSETLLLVEAACAKWRSMVEIVEASSSETADAEATS